ncbi:MarC family protein [uncultured Parasutterella sp.]|uniref:MarC family protein n=1 Tax=uncultured Parasutterella sp. TaxID=1263098 RepID=UPI0025B72212|nr:MarC family protein [uncultured Parasutterella sp.]
MLTSFFNTFLYVFTSLVTVVNPLGAAFFFLTMTGRATRQERAELSNRVALYFFVMAMCSLYIGQFILSFFGISIGVLRVAGGLVLFSAGWLTLNSSSSSAEADGEKAQSSMDKKSHSDLMKLAFYPFTLPLTLGPGAIAVTTAIGTSMTFSVPNVLSTSLAALANALLVWLCFKYADRITTVFGQTGTEAISRIFAFILICIGVQVFWSGFSELWLHLMATAK